MLMKLAAGVNFINILLETFLYQNVLCSFSLVSLGFVIFWCKNFGAKAARKMWMKLTTGVNFINPLVQSANALVHGV